MFGQPLEAETLAAATKAVDEADLLLVVRTPLAVLEFTQQNTLLTVFSRWAPLWLFSLRIRCPRAAL